MDWPIALDELEHPAPAPTVPLAAALPGAGAGRLRGDVPGTRGHDPG